MPATAGVRSARSTARSGCNLNHAQRHIAAQGNPYIQPSEIRGVRLTRIESRAAAEPHSAGACAAANLEEVDFLQTKTLRKLIHARERSRCFYCLRRTTPAVYCLDHVVPQARLGRNSYRNLVSSCVECNSQKGEKPADDFLRRLYRDRHLTAAELAARLRAIDDLAAGKLRPPLPNSP